jgi:succinate-semialdehyde dehydrogenase/glutarate-semialdehyde dehydrogenase
MAAFDEETFGPVAAIVPAMDAQDAIRLANLSSFGLGAAVFTRDLDRGESVALKLEAGTTFVNAQVASIRASPSAASRSRGTAASWGATGSRSS